MMKRGIFLLLVLSLIISENAEGQKKNRKVVVSGYVTDVNNQPVASAMILVDRQQTDVFTTRKGFYKVRVYPEARMIGAYSAEKGSAEAATDGSREVNIVLYGTFAIQGFVPEEGEGNELINVGYGKVRKKDLTSAPGKINGKENKYASYSNIYDMIRGEIPGVQVMGNEIIIRGINSINSGTGPLFVVDGMVVSSIDAISPQEVRSITVLKGSDAAIYGTRAAGGVILIDLKGAGDR
jgi:TonB-dependent SusC/RagA subfamily outer membrane receptor